MEYGSSGQKHFSPYLLVLLQECLSQNAGALANTASPFIFWFYLWEHLTWSFKRSGVAGGASLMSALGLRVRLPAVGVLLG